MSHQPQREVNEKTILAKKTVFQAHFCLPHARFAGLITRHKNKRHMAYRQTYLNTICAGINITEREGPVFPGGMP